MRPESPKYLFDMITACDLLTDFVAGKGFDDYEADRLLQAGVEREFEIIGEALSQLARIDPETAQLISDYARVISFRNILIHGYAAIQNQLVWDIVERRLPTLRAEVKALLDSV